MLQPPASSAPSTPAARSSRVGQWALRVAKGLQNALLSPHPPQQIRIGRWSMATLLYGLVWWVAESSRQRWQLDPDALRVFEWGSLLVSVLFYALMRSGLNLQCPDPALTVPQIVTAQVLSAYAYALMPPARGALLMLQVLALFFGLFNLGPRQLWSLCASGVLMAGATMSGLAQLAPQRFEPHQEQVHFVILLTLLPTVVLMARQLQHLRGKLQRQQRALDLALTRLQNQAHHDELTGLYSRRFMLEMLHLHLAAQTRHGQSATLALIDLDHFKRINDEHGHRIGDEALRTFARQLQNGLREIDLLSRWSGEAFLVLLPHTRPDQAQLIFERLAQHLRGQPVFGAPDDLRVRFSAGLTNLPPDESIDRAIERADEALNLAKAQGRDQSVICIGA